MQNTEKWEIFILKSKGTALEALKFGTTLTIMYLLYMHAHVHVHVAGCLPRAEIDR